MCIGAVSRRRVKSSSFFHSRVRTEKAADKGRVKCFVKTTTPLMPKFFKAEGLLAELVFVSKKVRRPSFTLFVCIFSTVHFVTAQ